MPNEQTPLAVVIATKPFPHPEHVTAEQERELLEHFNCTLMNNGSIAHMVDPYDFPNAKFIIPIFGYPESWGKAAGTYGVFKEYGYIESGNTYYYNCGGTIDGEQWNGLDEPGTRGEEEGRVRNYEEARSELRCVKAFLPGLKRVATHPWPVAHTFEGDWLKPDVGGWRLSLMEQYMAEYADRLAAIPELWAYLINSDFPVGDYSNLKRSNTEWAAGIGPRVRAVGATCLLINDTSLLGYLFDYSAGKLTPVGKALLEGCRDA